MMIQRRGFLAGLGALLAAPAIIRTPGLLMPVKLAAKGVDFGRDEGTIVFFSTPTGDGWLYERWLKQAEKDVKWLTGAGDSILSPGTGYHPGDRMTLTKSG